MFPGRHDRTGLTVVEIVLLIALIVLPLTLVLILFGKDIKRWVGRNWGTARSESEKLYKQSSGTGIGTQKGQVGAAGGGDAAGGEAGGGGGGSDTGSSGGRASAPLQSSDRTQRGTGGGGSSEPASSSDQRPANLGVVAIAVCVALVLAMALSGKRLK